VQDPQQLPNDGSPTSPPPSPHQNIQTSLHNHDHITLTGDPITVPKATNTIRLYFQNINGIGKNNWLDWKRATLLLKEQEIDIFGCAETNTSWTKAKRKYAQSMLQKTTRQANLSVSSSTECGTSDYQPGGVASCITGKWTGRIIEAITDTTNMGRWSGHILLGKQQQHAVIISAYQSTKSQGYNTTYQQQWRIIRNRDQNNPMPREQLLVDLSAAIHPWTAKQYEVILMWDANDSIHYSRSKLRQFMTSTNLIPAHTTFPKASYSRGASCIDYIMTTPEVHNAITASGYLPFYAGIWDSDHRGVFVDLSASILFNSATTDLHTPQTRQLCSNNRTQVFRFISNLELGNQLPHILQRLQTLEKSDKWSPSQQSLFETLDTEFTKTLLQCESQCALPNPADWHPNLHHCYLIYRYWKTKVAVIRNNKHVETQLMALKEKVHRHNINIHQDDHTRPFTYQLRLAKKHLT
jgi:hypothetical protein